VFGLGLSLLCCQTNTFDTKKNILILSSTTILLTHTKLKYHTHPPLASNWRKEGTNHSLMAFTVSLTCHIHGATQCKKFPPLSSSLCNLSSGANVVDMRLVSRCGLQKVGSNHRNFRVNALFGGKKDNEQSGDKVSQVCFLLPSLLHMNIHTRSQNCFCIHIFYLFAFFTSFT
jgi:hypothetical protein